MKVFAVLYFDAFLQNYWPSMYLVGAYCLLQFVKNNFITVIWED